MRWRQPSQSTKPCSSALVAGGGSGTRAGGTSLVALDPDTTPAAPAQHAGRFAFAPRFRGPRAAFGRGFA